MSYNNQPIYKSNLTYVTGSVYPLNEVNQFLIPLKSHIQNVMENIFRKPKLTSDRIMNILRYILTHPDILAYVEEAMEKERRQILGISDEAQVTDKIVNENDNSIEEGELTDTPNKQSVQKCSEIVHNISKSTISHDIHFSNETVSDLKTGESSGCKRALLKEMTSSERNKRHKLITEHVKKLTTKDKRISVEKEAKTQRDENQRSDDKRNRHSADKVNRSSKINDDNEYRSSSEKEGKNYILYENRRSFSNERGTYRREKSTSRERKIPEERGSTNLNKKKRTTTESDNECYSSVKRKRTSSACNVKASYSKSKYRSPRKMFFHSRHSSFSISSNILQRGKSLSSRRSHQYVHEKPVRKSTRSPKKESSKTCSEPDLDEFQKANRKTYNMKIRSPLKSQNKKKAVRKIEDKSEEKIVSKKIKACEQNDTVDKEESAEEGELEDEEYAENFDVSSSVNICHETNTQSQSGQVDISLENITSDDAVDLNTSSKIVSMPPSIPPESKNVNAETSENAFTRSKIVPNRSKIVQANLVVAKSPSSIETPERNITLSTAENKESPGSGLKEKQKCRKKKPLTYYISCKVQSPSTSTTTADISDFSTFEQESEKVTNLSGSPTKEKNSLPFNLEEKLKRPVISDNINNKTDSSKLQNLAKPSNYCDIANSDDLALSDQLFNEGSCKEGESESISQIPLIASKDNLSPIKQSPDPKKWQKVTNSTSAPSNIFIDNNKLVDYDELNYETLELSPKCNRYLSQHAEFPKVPLSSSHRRKSPSPKKYELKFSRFKKEEPKRFKSLYTKRMEIKIKALKDFENAQSSSTPSYKEEEDTIPKKKKKKSSESVNKILPIKVSTKDLTSKVVAIHSSEKSSSLCSSNITNMPNAGQESISENSSLCSSNSSEKSISKTLQNDVSTVNPSKDKSNVKSSTHPDSCLPWELSCSEMPTLNSPEKLSSANLSAQNSLISPVKTSNSKLVHDTPVTNSPTRQILLSSSDKADLLSKTDNVNLSNDIPVSGSPVKAHTVDLTSQNLTTKLTNEASDLNSSNEVVLVSNSPEKVPDEDSSDKISSKISPDETFVEKSPIRIPHPDSFKKVTPACFSNEDSASHNDVTVSSSNNAISAVSPTKSTSNSSDKTAITDSSNMMDISNSSSKNSVTDVPNKTIVISTHDSPVKGDSPQMKETSAAKKETWTKAEDREILSTCKTYGASQISFQMVANALKSNKTPELIKTRFEFLMDIFKRKMLQKAMNKTQ